MTLRTVTYDTATHKIVPIELSNELTSLLADVIDDPENDRSSWDLAENIHSALIAAAPEYQEQLNIIEEIKNLLRSEQPKKQVETYHDGWMGALYEILFLIQNTEKDK